MLNAPTWQHQKPIELAHEPDVQIGDAWLRPASRMLEWSGTSRTLEPRVAQLLVALARQGGGVLGRDDLIDLCWEGRIVGDDAINRCVAKARRASADAGFNIETVPRVGYRLIERKRSAFARFHRRGAAVAVASLLIAVAAALWLRPTVNSTATLPAIAVGKFTTTETDVAIAGKTSEISGQIVHVLTNLGFPTSGSIGPKSGAERYLVTGSVAQQPMGLLAKVQIADVQNGSTIVSQELSLDRDELPLLPDQVAALVGDILSRVGSYYVLTEGSPDSGETAAFLSIMLKIASGESLEGLAAARRFQTDRPQSRLAPFALSFATVYAIQQRLPLEDREKALREGQAATLLAHRRLPRLGDAYVADCWLQPLTFAQCERVYRQAMAVDEVSPTVRSLLAWQLMHAGRLEEAQPLASAALAHHPYFATKVHHSLYLAQYRGQRGEELRLWRYAQRHWPRLRFARQRFVGLLATGRWREAEKLVPLVVRLDPSAEDKLATVFAALRNPTNANRRAVRRGCDDDLAAGMPIVCILGASMLGDGTDSVKLAKRHFPIPFSPNPAIRQSALMNGRDLAGLFLLWGDGARTMRNEPSFAEFAQRNGLLDYWKSNGSPDFCRRERAPVCKLI
jgi:DNA-binding winged helix-turn-helix (wHTH) protein